MSSIFYSIRCLMHMLCHNKQSEINAIILLTSFTFLCQIIFTLFFSRPIRYEHNMNIIFTIQYDRDLSGV